MAIRFLYFDLGNVLLSFSHERMCQQMAAAAQIDAESVRRALFEAIEGRPLQWRFEAGEFGTNAAYDQFCQAIGRQPDQSALYTAASDIFTEMPESVALVRRLSAAGNRMGVLSNTNPIDWEFVSRQFPFLGECFDQLALSYQARSMKPDPAIFAYAVRCADAPAHEVFFTDDRKENVAGALAAGLDAVLFTGAEQIARELRQRGVLGA